MTKEESEDGAMLHGFYEFTGQEDQTWSPYKVKELLKEFESDGSAETHSPQSHGFFDKVRELWEDLKE